MTDTPPPPAPPPAPAGRQKWSKKRKSAVWAAAGFVVLVAIGSAGTDTTTQPETAAATTTTEAAATTTTAEATTTTEAADPFIVWMAVYGPTVLDWLEWAAAYPTPTGAEGPAELVAYCQTRWLDMTARYGPDGTVGDVDAAYSASPDPVIASAGTEAYLTGHGGLFACSLGDFDTGSELVNQSAELLDTLSARFEELTADYKAADE